MKYLKMTIWLIAFIGITVIFNLVFRMHYTPAGLMGEVTTVNIFASVAYLVLWIILSLVSGVKKYRSILAASIIYSSLPFVSLIGTLFMGTPLAILILVVFYWSVPVQGIHYVFVYLQLPLFLLGYIIGSGNKSNRLRGNEL